MIKNIGIQWTMTATVDTFTSPAGIWIRRKINPVLRRILRLAAKNRIFIEEYPNIPKNQPVIFAATHSFDEDTISSLASVDRNAYVLVGTTDQLEYNRQMYAAWLNGMIYVDRCDAKSRKASVEKMERILRSGTSILMFPEGGLNNTENLLVNPLFSGPWLLARDTGLPVVPMAEFHEQGTKNVYLYAGEPLNIGTMEKDEALSLLRNEMARRIYRAIEEHTLPVERKKFGGGGRLIWKNGGRSICLYVGPEMCGMKN